jgi:hypothetical protein
MRLGIVLMLVGNWMLAGAVVYEMRRGRELRRRFQVQPQAQAVPIRSLERQSA